MKKESSLKKSFSMDIYNTFIFVILNLMILDFYEEYFLVAYIVLLIVYFAVFRNKPDEKTKDNNSIKDDGNNKGDDSTKNDSVADRE